MEDEEVCCTQNICLWRRHSSVRCILWNMQEFARHAVVPNNNFNRKILYVEFKNREKKIFARMGEMILFYVGFLDLCQKTIESFANVLVATLGMVVTVRFGSIKTSEYYFLISSHFLKTSGLHLSLLVANFILNNPVT